MASLVPNIEATMAETQSNTTSLFARESASTDCGQCESANTCYQAETRKRIRDSATDSVAVTTLTRNGLIDYREFDFSSAIIRCMVIHPK